MGTDVDRRDIDLRRLDEMLGERPAVFLDRSVEVVLGQGVRGVLHRVGGDDQAVVAVRVGGPEVAIERDRDGQVADPVVVRSVRDPDEADGRLAVPVRAEFDHVVASRAAAVIVA